MADDWNPIEALKAKYPQIGLSDAQIMQNLQDPAKFRSAFPEYDGVTDDNVRTNMGKFAMRHPEYAPPPAPSAPVPEGLQPNRSYLGDTLPAVSPSMNPKLMEAMPGAHMPPSVGAGIAGAAAASAGGLVAPEAWQYVGPVAKRLLIKHPIIGAMIGSYAINKAKDIPVVGPVIKHIPYAEMLPWLFAGKGGGEPSPPENPGAPLPETPPEELTQAAPLSRGGGKPGVDPSQGLGNIPVAQEPPAVNPGAPYPAAPSAELKQAQSLTQQPRTIPDPAAGLGEVRVRPTPGPAPSEPPPQPAPKPTSQAELRRQLDQALPTAPQPGQPIYPRPNAAPQAETPSAPIPDLTPIEGSSAVEGYHYDPESREFFYKEKRSGTTYVFGDVSPETAKAFEEAGSKGRALDLIRKQPGSVHVAKIINGKRIAVKPTIKATPF